MKSSWLGQLLNSTRAKVIDLQKKLAARDIVVRSIVVDSCATLTPSFRSLVQNFRAGPFKSVSEAFRAGSIPFQRPADTAIDGITLRFRKVLSRKMMVVPSRAKKLLIPLLAPKSSNAW